MLRELGQLKLNKGHSQHLAIRVSCHLRQLGLVIQAILRDLEMALLELSLHSPLAHSNPHLNSRLWIRWQGWPFKIWTQARSRFLKLNSKNGFSRRMTREYSNNPLNSRSNSKSLEKDSLRERTRLGQVVEFYSSRIIKVIRLRKSLRVDSWALGTVSSLSQLTRLEGFQIFLVRDLTLLSRTLPVLGSLGLVQTRTNLTVQSLLHPSSLHKATLVARLINHSSSSTPSKTCLMWENQPRLSQWPVFLITTSILLISNRWCRRIIHNSNRRLSSSSRYTTSSNNKFNNNNSFSSK